MLIKGPESKMPHAHSMNIFSRGSAEDRTGNAKVMVFKPNWASIKNACVFILILVFIANILNEI